MYIVLRKGSDHNVVWLHLNRGKESYIPVCNYKNMDKQKLKNINAINVETNTI